MIKDHRINLGMTSEYMVQAWLSKKGYHVFTSKTGPIDLIAFKPETKEILYLDVKTLTHRKNGGVCSTTRPLKYPYIKLITVDPKTGEIFFNDKME